MPTWLQLPESLRLQFRVPKFHLPAHVPRCWAPYSFNFAKGVGRTDGEGVERNWSWLNGIARSLSMMGPGGRSDTLDDFCNYHNWRKTTALGERDGITGAARCLPLPGKQLLRRLTLAIPEAVLHHRAFTAFSEGIRDAQPQTLIMWQRQAFEWENGLSDLCPYELPDESMFPTVLFTRIVAH